MIPHRSRFQFRTLSPPFQTLLCSPPLVLLLTNLLDDSYIHHFPALRRGLLLIQQDERAMVAKFEIRLRPSTVSVKWGCVRILTPDNGVIPEVVPNLTLPPRRRCWSIYSESSRSRATLSKMQSGRASFVCSVSFPKRRQMQATDWKYTTADAEWGTIILLSR